MKYYVVGLLAAFVFSFVLSCLTRPPIQNVVPVQIVDVPKTQRVVATPVQVRIHTKIGDLNCDGVIDFCDIDPFVDAITNEGQYLSDYGYDCVYRGFLPYPFAADCDGDGEVTMADVNPFVDILLGITPPPNFAPIIGWSRLQDDFEGIELLEGIPLEMWPKN